MRKTGYVFLLLLLILIAATDKLSAGNTMLVHSDMGTYNQRYYDLYFKDNNEASFGMKQSSFGMEYTHTNSERISTGGGFALTNMEEGKYWNFNNYEAHPLTIVMVPYAFTGYAFNYFGCELGISCYLQFSKHEAELYYLQDGSEIEAEKGSIRLDRKYSHTFINAKIRLFNEKSIHCKIMVGRENFDPIDSLINIAVVYPFNKHRMEYYLSFLTLDNYLYTLFNQDNVLKTNQTTGLSYSYDLGIISFGVRGGILIYNAHGGNATVSLENRLNCGIFTVLRW